MILSCEDTRYVSDPVDRSSEFFGALSKTSLRNCMLRNNANHNNLPMGSTIVLIEFLIFCQIAGVCVMIIELLEG